MNTIRRAREEDIPRIMDLLTQVCMVHHNGRPDLFKGPATKYTPEELKTILADDTRPVFVSLDESGYLQGYAFCILKEETENHVLTSIRTLYIDDLCVDEAFRGRHIGQELYRYVLTYAGQIGCYNLTLNVWACNESAMKFYEKCGLVPQKIGLEKIITDEDRK